MADVELLERVPLLANLPDEVLLRLATEAEGTTVRAGDWLFREGEQADSLFIIRSGRLEVVQEGPPEVVVRVMRRGEVLGELALLRGDRRSASVRAQRDSRLLELGRDQFEEMVRSAPGFALGLTRAIGERLASNGSDPRVRRRPTTIALVALDRGRSVRGALDELARRLDRDGDAIQLDSTCAEHEHEMAAVLDHAEQDGELVLMEAGGEEGPWREFCLREAELIVAFTSGRPEQRWRERPAALYGCELVVVGGRPEKSLAADLRPRELQIVPSAGRAGGHMAVLARRLCGRAVGVVLSGGGARAFAHIGALEELHAAGIVIDRIGGVSLGAIVAGALADGDDPTALYDRFERGFLATNPSSDFTLPAYSLIRGRRTRSLLTASFGAARIEELRRRFFCMSCDLIAREPVVHRSGPLAEAIYASLAIPGVFPPVNTADGRLLVDGGVLDNLPVATMAERGEGPVIAIDVTGPGGLSRPEDRPGLARAGRAVRRYLTGSEAAIPRLGETIVRTVTVGSSDTVAAARRHADLLICPEVEGIGLTDWRALPRVREIGRRAAAAALAAAPGALLD